MMARGVWAYTDNPSDRIVNSSFNRSRYSQRHPLRLRWIFLMQLIMCEVVICDTKYDRPSRVTQTMSCTGYLPYGALRPITRRAALIAGPISFESHAETSLAE